MVAEVVERYLRRDGHDVTLAFDGQSALDQFAKERADLVILDIDAPPARWLRCVPANPGA